MANVVLKPELRTPGGETVSIYVNDEWAGDLYLVYREGDVLTGTIQIDTSKVEEEELDNVTEEVRTYVEHLNAALGVEESSVVMMYGDISAVVEMEPFSGVVDEEGDIELEMVGDEEDDDYFEDDEDEYEDLEDEPFHLSVVYRNGEHTKYQLHNEEHEALGLVAVDEIGDNVSGRVEFWEEPDEEQTNDVARMLARTFATGETETISFTMNYEHEHLGNMHLERREYEELPDLL